MAAAAAAVRRPAGVRAPDTDAAALLPAPRPHRRRAGAWEEKAAPGSAAGGMRGGAGARRWGAGARGGGPQVPRGRWCPGGRGGAGWAGGGARPERCG